MKCMTLSARRLARFLRGGARFGAAAFALAVMFGASQAQAQPTSVVVRATALSTELSVVWMAPRFVAVTEYRVRWASGAGSTTWINTGDVAGVSAGTNLAHTITGLTVAERYDVQVGAIVSGSTTPTWSASVGGIVHRGILASLALLGSDGQPITLSPAFDAGEQNYTASVAATISSVAAIATTIGGGAFFLSDDPLMPGRAVVSGETSDPASLPVGEYLFYVGALSNDDNAVTLPHVITITRAAPSAAPNKPTVTLTARETALRATWTVPSGDIVEAYEITWRTAATTTPSAAAGAWQDAAGDDAECAAAADPGAADDCGQDVGMARTGNIVSLTAATAYEVRVRAINSEGNGAWSDVASKTTGTTEDATLSAIAMLDTTPSGNETLTLSPAFSAETESYAVAAVNAVSMAALIPTANVSAATITVAVGGAAAATVASGATSATGAPAEGGSVVFNVVVTATDGSTTKTYVITVNRANGVPGAPASVAAAPSARGDRADVTWSPPTEFGGVSLTESAITAYRVRWRAAAQDPDGTPGNADDVAAGAWQDLAGDDAECADADAANDAECGEDARSGSAYTIAGLTPATTYDVAVAAVTAQGAGAWSADAGAQVAPDAMTDAALKSLLAIGIAADKTETTLQLQPVFDADIFSYTATMPNALVEAKADPCPVNSLFASIAVKVGDAPVDTQHINCFGTADTAVAEGDTLLIVIVVTAQSGGATRTYTVGIMRAPGLPGAPQNVTARPGLRSGSADAGWGAPTYFGGANLDETAITAYRVRWREADTDSGMSGDQPGEWQDLAGADAECNNADAADDAMCGQAAGVGGAYTIAGLTDGAQYEIAVAAVNAQGVGAWSGDGDARVTPNDARDAFLSDLLVTGSNGSGAALTKTGDLSGAGFAPMHFQYEARLDHAATAVTLTPTLSADSASVTLDGIAQTSGMASAQSAPIAAGGSAVFTVRVSSRNRNNRVYRVTVLRSFARPAAPQVTDVIAGDGEVTMRWLASPDPEGAPVTGYVVQLRRARRLASTFWRFFPTEMLGASAREHTFSAPNGGNFSGSREVRVAAVNSAGQGGWAGHGRFVTPGPASAPSAPSAPMVSDNAAVTLTWVMPAANRAAITNYDARWRTSATDADGIPGNADDVAAGNWQGNTAAAGEPVVIGDADEGVAVGEMPTHSIAGLSVGASYDFQVRAQNRIGKSGWSPSQSAVIVLAGNARLSALVVNDGSGDLALTKNGARSTAGFDAEHTTYSVPDVAADIAEIIITATAPATAASISINGIAAASGEAATRMLEFGDNLLRIAVTAADGATSRTYRISLHRTRP
ncbi:MAG: cadherin-like beta sandwich domain-containing protein, partial [Gammaproteobacteria bacterium]